jgi:fructose-bisphosphate aldolase class I
MSNSLQSTVATLFARGKGILAADETVPTTESRFKPFDIVCTPANRRAYREMLFTTPGLNNFISGVIMVDETIRQQSAAGVFMPQLLATRSILPGVTVDKGTVSLAAFRGEEVTEGLDGLRDRLNEYRELGACFAKWRAAIAINNELPTHTCIDINVRALALFASLSQEAGLVPIVEPEILMNGSHTIKRCEEVACSTLQRMFIAFVEHRVVLEEIVLKTGMILPGAQCLGATDVGAVAEATLRCLRRAVPAAVPGIVFLSGGQGDAEATERLNAICQSGDAPWQLSFCFSRALQMSALMNWKGSPSNIPAAQSALYHRAKCNSAATQGEYFSEMELSN